MEACDELKLTVHLTRISNIALGPASIRLTHRRRDISFPSTPAYSASNAANSCLNRSYAHVTGCSKGFSFSANLPCSVRRSSPSAMAVSGESPGSRARVRNKLVRRTAPMPLCAAGTPSSMRSAASLLSATHRHEPERPYRDPASVILLRGVPILSSAVGPCHSEKPSHASTSDLYRLRSPPFAACRTPRGGAPRK
ncbi:hypothetical protein BD311DRAFT_174508 [Dichomitus squalens]|uniref:Uncharacterized protein n=1 Tax=Dichomitus squalens TaxID=114155 RepID=A0A4Q9MW00_9APHY|nr:hypothetical protein BD311DRAFT_174508 [Dichomitus squalens]